MENLEQQEAEKKKELEEQAAQAESAGDGSMVIVGGQPSQAPDAENPFDAVERLKSKSMLDVLCSKYGVSGQTVSKKPDCLQEKEENRYHGTAF